MRFGSIPANIALLIALGGSLQAQSPSPGNVGYYIATSFGLFAEMNDNATGWEPYKIDPATGVATLLKDINPGTGSSYPQRPILLNGQVLFVASASTNAFDLWRTDGTSEGTVLVMSFHYSSLASFFDNPVICQNKVYFTVASGNGIDVELWATDGTTLGTQRISFDIPGYSIDRSVSPVVLGTHVFFDAADVTNRNVSNPNASVLLRVDGSTLTTLGDFGNLIYQLGTAGNKLYIVTVYHATDQYPSQLLATNGTNAPHPIRGFIGPPVWDPNIPCWRTQRADAFCSTSARRGRGTSGKATALSWGHPRSRNSGGVRRTGFMEVSYPWVVTRSSTCSTKPMEWNCGEPIRPEKEPCF